MEGKIVKVTSGTPYELKELKYGMYTVEEINAEGYKTTYKPENGMVEVGEKEAKVTIWNKAKEEVVMDDGMLTIHKVLKDSEGNVITEPHTFKIKVTGPSYPEGKYYEIKNGTPLVLKDLEYGHYTVMEKDTEGYYVTMKPEEGKVKVDKDKPGEVTIWNKEKEEVVEDDGVLWIHKYLMNAWGKEIEEGREFTIKVTGPSYPAGKEYKIMSGEKLMLDGLKYGEYTIVELNADGYEVVMYPKTGVVMVGATPVVLKIWNKEKMVMEDKGMLTIHKYLKDSEGNIIEEPMKFEIHVTGPSFPEGKHFEIMNGTPLVLKDLKYGKYIVEETAVEGYKTTMWPENGEVWVKMFHPATLKIWNMEMEDQEVDDNGVLWIHKYLTNMMGKPVMESREFTVKVTGPSYPAGKEFKVMSGDKLMLDGLKYGEYTIVELDAEDYMVTMMPASGKVMVGETPVDLKIWNKEKMVMDHMGMLTIHKYLKDSEGNIITEPMKFEIHVTGPSFPEGKHFEIMNGTPLVLKDLMHGKYSVVETAVEGYETIMEPANGEVWVMMHHPATLKIWNMEMEDEEVDDNGVLWIHKYLMDSWGRPVMASKEFTIKVTGPSFPEGKEFKVMSGDKLMINNLEHGEYTIVELNAEGYMVTMMPWTGKVMVGETPAALKIWNKEKMVMEDKGMLTIHKYLKDSEGNIIEEPMKFEIHVTGPSFPEGKHFEIMNGTPLVLKDLMHGKYTVVETAVEGYKTTMEPANGEVWVMMHHPATLKIWNMEEEMEEEEVGTLIIKKYLKDSDGEMIDEAREFKINIKGPSFPEGKDFTIKNGVEWKMDDLKFGEYTVVEKNVEGYKVTMDPATGKVTVCENPVTLKIWNMEEEVEEVMGELVIHKVLLDNMGKPVTDIREFKIWVKGPSYTEWKEFTVKNGTPLVIKDLKLGQYEVKEVGAEDYEVKISEILPLTETHRTHTVTVTNMEEALGQLTIHKVLKDEDGKVITTAKEFKIWVKGPSFPNGKEFTVKNGTDLVIKDLVYGTYTVTEPGAMDDYKVSITQSPKLTITAKMGHAYITNTEIEVEDVSPLPQTGGVSSSVLYLMSSIMILGGLGLLRKKED